MRRGSLFLQYFLVAVAGSAAVGTSTWWILEREAGRFPFLLLGAEILVVVLSLLLSYLLVRRHIRTPLLRLVSYARGVLEGRYDAVPETGTGEIRELSEAFRRMTEAIREREASLADLAKFTAANPNLVMMVDPEGRILFANQGVERTLYEVGLPPQHGELLLPEEPEAIAGEVLASAEKKRSLTCEAEGRTIEYTIYGFEDEKAVVFHGVDVTDHLPAREGKIAVRKPPGPSPSKIRPAPPGGTVLLVDDEALVREVAGAMLVSLGLEVLAAANGQEGVDLFRRERERISFAILDLRMPEMDGVRAFEMIRAIDPAAKIVISTGFSGDEDVDRLKERGAAAVLSKPYTYAEIARVAGLFQAPVPYTSTPPVQEK